MHRIADPAILYFGTPVVLISTLNSDGTPNLAPMSSAWWLGHHAMLGLAGSSMTTQNLLRERECVLNLPDVAKLSAIPSDLVRPPRVAQCPIQLEATLVEAHPFGGFAQALEVRVERVHAEEDVLATPNRIDPDEWRPLIMSFQRFYGLTREQAGSSRLAEIPEESYRRNGRPPVGATRSHQPGVGP
jgi:flavin reductase (DIM6/NTAB) family NADH-FMN oxidoreductase RutF